MKFIRNNSLSITFFLLFIISIAGQVLTAYKLTSMEMFKKNELKKIGNYLLKRKETIAVAESVTSGLLQYAFSNIPDAAQFSALVSVP